ncbi:MAG: Zn-dependent alcohol dehydrogenase [Herpetosiphon sp.]
MKAAVCYEFGEPLVIEEIAIGAPQRGEVKVRLAATAICHSDVHAIRGEWGGTMPFVAGHEAAGVVEAIGDGVTLTTPGDAVVVSLLRSCGQCFFCTRGAPHCCEATWLLDTERRLHKRGGAPIRQGLRVGAFAEYVIVDQSQVVSVPPAMPLDRAALLACGVITGLGAVVNTAHVEPASNVVVIGTGGVGLNSIQGAVLAGAKQIIAVDRVAAKLEAACVFGATDTIHAGEHDAVAAVKALTAGRGADYCFVTVGSTTAIEQGFQMIRSQGLLVIVGVPGMSATVALPVAPFPLGERRVMGSFMGSTRLSVDVPRLVERYLEGHLKLDELITARYPLEHINEAIEIMEQGTALRNLIMF